LPVRTQIAADGCLLAERPSIASLNLVAGKVGSASGG
jgi:hypothetical protein